MSTVNVLESTEIVHRDSELVKINNDAIELYCSQWQKEPFVTPDWDTDVHWTSHESYKLANYILLLDCLNFCFWPDLGDPKWQINYKDEIVGGYQALAMSLKRAIEDGLPVYEAGWMANATMKDVKRVFRSCDGATEIPLLDKRLEHINETGTVLLENFHGQFAEAILECRQSAVDLVKLIVEYFPSFRDIHTWNSHKVYILKRAQITAVDIYGSFNGQDLGKFADIDKLTVFADYKIPQVMRALGILEYAPSLAEKVDRQELIPSGSREELEIRVGMIWAAEEMRRTMARLGTPKKSLEIDWYLWNLGQRSLPNEKPYHRTRTVFY
ncbi:queuosine salvage family protein [bacterium]|nr:queuosine salvage family protein [bacterium]